MNRWILVGATGRVVAAAWRAETPVGVTVVSQTRKAFGAPEAQVWSPIDGPAPLKAEIERDGPFAAMSVLAGATPATGAVWYAPISAGNLWHARSRRWHVIPGNCLAASAIVGMDALAFANAPPCAHFPAPKTACQRIVLDIDPLNTLYAFSERERTAAGMVAQCRATGVAL